MEVWQNVVIVFIFVGLGFGLAFTPSIIITGQYFNRWRYMATAFGSCGGALGNIIFTVVFNKTIEIYGWRGSMLLNGGIALNLVLCGALMRPLPLTSSGKSLICDVTLLLDVRMLMFAASTILWSLGTTPVFILSSDYLKERGIEHDKAVFLITIIAIANLPGRLLAGVTAFIPYSKYTNLWVYTVSILGYALATMLFNTGGTCAVFYLYGAIFGFLFGIQIGANVNVIIDCFGIKKLSNIYGYLAFAEGIGKIAGPPIAG